VADGTESSEDWVVSDGSDDRTREDYPVRSSDESTREDYRVRSSDEPTREEYPYRGGGERANDDHRFGSEPPRSDYRAEHPPPSYPPLLTQTEPRKRHHSRNPLDRLTAGLPRPWRIAIDWVVTIAGAIAIVLAIKAWVVNPYRIPSSSMEPTLHCARPGQGCEARLSDRVLANRFIYHFRSPHRGEIVVFNTPKAAQEMCGASGTFVKRLIGLPGDLVTEKDGGWIYINGQKLNEPYIKTDRRERDSTTGSWHVPKGSYFFMGDNRGESCDSRRWGSVPRGNLIGEVFATYWPPNRISLHTILPGAGIVGLLLVLPLLPVRRRKRSGVR
jgi:signal peptidase I